METLWRWLTQPSTLIQDAALRRKASLLSGLLVIIFILQAVALILSLIFIPDYQLIPFSF